MAQHGGSRSGFRLLATGADAFVARAVLIELAERSLDLQYYIFHLDNTGSAIVDRLLAAADRGVRVRLLLDDWGTLEKRDQLVAALDAHRGIDVRLFNPYLHRSLWGRVAELAGSFGRVNRRMHNKQLIADGQVVVTGGRNIGDEYFGAGDLDFQDVDVLAGGPVVDGCGATFEAYWNSPLALPISQLAHPPSGALRQAVRTTLQAGVTRLHESPYGRALSDSDLAKDLRAQAAHAHWAEAEVLADPPGKLTQPLGTRNERYLGARLAGPARAVQRELLVVSPYFVPGKDGVALLGERRRAGAAVRVLTNSLAATDVWLVHAGYIKHRGPLLEQGVQLYELKPERHHRPGVTHLVGSSRASLHGKTFVFDRRSVFIGSMNVDPRSLEQNTEGGVLVHSPELAADVARLFEGWVAPTHAYEVRLTPGPYSRKPEWFARENGHTVRFEREPEAGFWRRTGAKLFSRLPIDWLI